jgi:RNA polymerase sigma factor (sigma-70 family)
MAPKPWHAGNYTKPDPFREAVMTVLSTLPPVVGSTPSAVDDDHVLVSRVRGGDRDAFGELWRRHAGAARSIAWRYAGLADPDDSLQEASRVVLAAILRGGGPFGEFRPYLAVAIRNAAISMSRRHVPEPVGDAVEIAEFTRSTVGDSTSKVLEGLVMARAFKALPARWQEVLWYVCVEDLSTAEVGNILGLSPNGTAALAKRARDGLRTAWMEAHLNDASFGPQCRTLTSDYSAYCRDNLTPERSDEIAEHLADCASCTGLIAEIRDSVRI